jgi:hypothetical protein
VTFDAYIYCFATRTALYCECGCEKNIFHYLRFITVEGASANMLHGNIFRSQQTVAHGAEPLPRATAGQLPCSTRLGCGSSLVISVVLFAVFLNDGAVLADPLVESDELVPKGVAGRGQRVVHCWRTLRTDVSDDDAVAFEFADCLGEHPR